MKEIKYLETDDVFKIFHEHVLPNLIDEWKYCPLPMERNVKNWKWEGKDLPRVISLLEFDEFIQNNNLSFKKALCINGRDDPEYEYVSCSDGLIVNFEDDCINHDVQRLDIEEKGFDFCMLNQTLEHLYDPLSALCHICDHMCPGGILYFNVPVINLPHGIPFHFYSGFTPTGIGTLLERAGFEILTIGQWGNKEYIKILFEEYDWPDYRKLINPGFSDRDHPVIAWAFARKPCTKGEK